MGETQLALEPALEPALELTTSHTKEVIWSIVVSKILPQPITTLFGRYNSDIFTYLRILPHPTPLKHQKAKNK